MSTNFTGVTFAKQKVTPADDAIVRRAILPDGILTGCALSYSGSTLTMAAGQLMVCGRQVKHPSAQNWAVSDATSGYARLLLTIDLTRTASKETFDQVVDTIEYATSADGFSELEQADINSAGTKYQIAVCVVSLGTGGITGIVEELEKSEASAGKLFAVIGVTYPAGSTCTCTNGSKTLTAKGTGGKALFVIPSAGTWTVTAVSGSKSTSKTVSITAEGQVETVTLMFEMILWEAGSDQNTSLTGGFAANDTNYVTIGDNAVTITGNRTYFGEGSNNWSFSGNFYTKKKVTKGEFEYFCVNIITNTGTNANNKAWLYAANEHGFTDEDTITRLEIPVTTGETGVFRMPLTGITSAVLGIRVYGHMDLQTIGINKIWLE